MFAFQDARGAVRLAFTDRHGGVSTGSYASLNLAASSGDEPAAVAENLRRAATALTAGSFTGSFTGSTIGSTTGSNGGDAPPVVGMRQVHGSDVVVVDAQHVEAAALGELPVGDALVTTQRGVVLMVRAADCVPVLLADPDAGVIGAVHAGRPGVAVGVVTQAVDAMRRLGAERIRGWIGPHVCGSCYEVPAPMRAQVAAAVPETFATTSWGTPALDIGAGVTAQLAAVGVAVEDVSRCTREDEDLYSYRRQGPASGRLAGLVWIRP